MKPLFLAAALTLATASLAGSPAWARENVAMGRPQLDPSLSLSAPTSNPLQSQMRQDYATQLQGEQRDLMRQNPSGSTRQELAIGHELNGYVPR